MNRIKEIKVEKLFDTFDHTIKLNDEGITLLHGENGFGKTTILRMIEALNNNDLIFFHNTLFKSFTILLEDDTTWTIAKQIHKTNNLITSFINLHSSTLKTSLFISKSTKKIDPNVIRADVTSKHEKKEAEEAKNALKALKSILKTSLIGIKRLETKDYTYNEDGDYSDEYDIETVVKYSKELIDGIKKALANSSETARKLDSSYPKRLTESIKNISYENLSNIYEKYENLQQKIEKYQKLGILEKEFETTEFDKNADDITKKVLLIYINDKKEELSVLEPLAERIELFLNIINTHFLYKKLKIDREKGFIFTSEITNEEIRPDKLSSGEQHQIVLFYSLLFKTKPNTLLLIDEPEISFHISWQNEFVNDLKKIVKLTGIYILIATHSPSIIGNNWDLAVELEEI